MQVSSVLLVSNKILKNTIRYNKILQDSKSLSNSGFFALYSIVKYLELKVFKNFGVYLASSLKILSIFNDNLAFASCVVCK